jgi:peptide/nickel transport system ATP-binding protein
MIVPDVAPPLLELDHISVDFERPADWSASFTRVLGEARPRAMRVVSDVSLALQEGEVLGLVGESGCGKSTIGRVAAGILDPSEGRRRYAGKDVGPASAARDRIDLRVQMVFQDHASSLNPRLRVGDAIGEAPILHDIIAPEQQDDYVASLMNRVGLDISSRRRYPHQFSGGQKARICIARALAVKPKILVCDESTAALDVSIQAQVLNLFMELRDEFKLTYLFVSHDLGVVQYICDRVAVMYLGRIVEMGCTDEVFSSAAHPYTQALLAEIPRLEPQKRRFAALRGEIPSPLNPPTGCHFHPRCPLAGPRCKAEVPLLKNIGGAHVAACHLSDGGVA